ncbi:hypothetical protein LTS12_027398 [Elasticomyces elasticus]|nr:hypothetical protein LTS12_027398 [Elasticomyces elasticus]
MQTPTTEHDTIFLASRVLDHVGTVSPTPSSMNNVESDGSLERTDKVKNTKIRTKRTGSRNAEDILRCITSTPSWEGFSEKVPLSMVTTKVHGRSTLGPKSLLVWEKLAHVAKLDAALVYLEIHGQGVTITQNLLEQATQHFTAEMMDGKTAEISEASMNISNRTALSSEIPQTRNSSLLSDIPDDGVAELPRRSRSGFPSPDLEGANCLPSCFPPTEPSIAIETERGDGCKLDYGSLSISEVIKNLVEYASCNGRLLQTAKVDLAGILDKQEHSKNAIEKSEAQLATLRKATITAKQKYDGARSGANEMEKTVERNSAGTSAHGTMLASINKYVESFQVKLEEAEMAESRWDLYLQSLLDHQSQLETEAAYHHDSIRSITKIFIHAPELPTLVYQVAIAFNTLHESVKEAEYQFALPLDLVV